jgi:hypothetical protein
MDIHTSISGAIAFVTALLAGAPGKPIRHVIKISGDGPNNGGPNVATARDKVVAAGSTINGLPIMPVTDTALFAEAITMKVLLEVAGTISVEAQVRHASMGEHTDCEGGELRRRQDAARSGWP